MTGARTDTHIRNKAAQQTWVVTTGWVSGTWCCFQRASSEGRRGHRESCVHVCAGQRWGGGPAQVVPCLHVSAHPLVHVCVSLTDTWILAKPQVAPINGRPTALSDVRCACPVDKIWSGICLSWWHKEGILRGEKWCKHAPAHAALR